MRTAATLLVGLLAGGVGPAGAQGTRADQLTILALGDSLTAGWGLAAEDAFPVRLEAALRARGVAATVIDAGVSGDTSAGGRARLDWALGAAPGDSPDAAIVALGANDALRGVDPADTEANLDAIVGALKDKGIAVLLAGMLAPPNMGAEYGARFNAVFPRVAARHSVALYPFFLDGVAADPRLNQPDAMHPNARGVSVMVDRITPYVLRLLEPLTKND